MLAVDRQSRLLELLRQRKSASLEAMSDELRVSMSTIRRDLELLEQSKQIERTHGGAVFVGEKSNPDPRPYAFEQRLTYHVDAKRCIASEARKLVSPGQTILIDGGTTTFFLAEQLRGMRLQLVTNSLPIAELYQNDDTAELILTGGLVVPRYGILLGPIAEDLLDNIHTQTLFLSVAGLHESSLFNQNQLLVQAERKMMKQSQQTVLLLDSTKLGQKALVKLGELADVDVLITDADPGKDVRKRCDAAGCRLIVAT